MIAGTLRFAAGTARAFDLVDSLPSIPTPAGSSGFVYRFDPATQTFVRESELTGQVYMERPASLVAGAWNLNFGYQWTQLDEVDGHATTPVQVHELVTGVTYGITDAVELNATVPVFSVGGEPFVQPVYFRSKYRFLESRSVDLAVGLVLRLLTDRLVDEATDGRAQPGLFVYGSGARIPLGRTYFQPFANLGADCDEVGTRDLEVRWSVGADWGVTDGFTAAVALLANDRPLLTHQVAFDPIARNTFDASVGGRFRLWRDTLAGIVNFLVPLNHDGLRGDLVTFVGVEAVL